MLKIFNTFFLLGVVSCAFSQQLVLKQVNDIPVIHNHVPLINAWAGGINSSTFSTADLNNDALEDIVLFDRQHSVPLVFLKTPDSYLFSPETGALLPSLFRYALFYDYDKDGLKDLFTATSGGIRVFKNESFSGSISFRLISNNLLTESFGTLINMDISTSDVPSLADADDDGDMDILHFRASQGTSVDFEKNMSMEIYGRPDSLHFRNIDNCWGGFMEVGCQTYYFGMDCKNNFRLEHIGAGSMLAFDHDADNDLDIVVGKEDCANLNYLANAGNKSSALFNKVNSAFPADFPANNMAYPLPFYSDADGDNIPDLIVTTGDNTPEDTSNLSGNILFYKNKGTFNLPVFTYSSNSFLQNQMIDGGRNASPAFGDTDNDGDQDLVITFASSSGKSASVYFYENTGSQITPSFVLKDTNFLSLRAEGYEELKTGFTDLNLDGYEDLVFNARSGTRLVVFTFYGSNNGIAASERKEISLPLQDLSSLEFTDVNQDGYQDLLAGTSEGNLDYFIHNKSTVLPGFSLAISGFGGITANAQFTNTNLSVLVADYEKDGKEDLLTIDDEGFFSFCPDFREQNPASFSLQKTYTNNDSVALGKNLSLACSVFSNQPFVFAGNENGGVFSFVADKKITNLLKNTTGGTSLKIYPNPSSGSFTIESESIEMMITDLSGTEVFYQKGIKSGTLISSVPPGTYVLKLTDRSNMNRYERIIVR